jgi:RND family efflux transporter MFP subunit
MTRRIGALLFAILLAAAAALPSCSKKEHGAAAKPDPGPAVRVDAVTVQPETLPQTYDAVGTVNTSRRSTLSSKAMGAVLALSVDEGDAVIAGQTLVVLDATDIEAQIRQAEAAAQQAQSAAAEVDQGIAAAQAGLRSAQAQLDLATKTYKRYETLLAEKSVSQQEFDQIAAGKKQAQAGVAQAGQSVEAMKSKKQQAQAQIRQAQSAAQQARVMLGFATISAPFDGIVVKKHVELGQMAAPGVPLLTIEDQAAYRLDAQVEETLLGLVKPGEAVAVKLNSYPDRMFEGVVSEVTPAVDPMTRTFTVKVRLLNAGGPPVRSGMYGKALLPTGSAETLRTPASAIADRGQMKGVFVITGDTARFRLIKTGRAYDDGSVEILSGLNPGDRIAVSGVDRLKDGSKVVMSQ